MDAFLMRFVWHSRYLLLALARPACCLLLRRKTSPCFTTVESTRSSLTIVSIDTRVFQSYCFKAFVHKLSYNVRFLIPFVSRRRKKIFVTSYSLPTARLIHPELR